MIVGTAGHIDHGKTMLVRALTGVDTDRLKEEKARGITIDLGFAYSPLGGATTVGFVDVPGHAGFIHNMLAGATGIDCALLVVAADDGVMPQTREHVAILDLLGVGRGVAAITKADLVPDSRRAEVAGELRSLLAGTSLEGLPAFLVSSITGEGVAELAAHLADLAAQSRRLPRPGHFRLAVDRCFSVAGHGLVVTGAALSGSIAPGDEVVVSPAGLPARVRAIHAAGRRRESGAAGERLALNLSGARLERSAVSRGDWIVAPAQHKPTSRLDVSLRVLASEARPASRGTPVHVHLGSLDVTGRLQPLEGPIEPGEAGFAQLVLAAPVTAAYGDRFIVRDQSARRTLGGGSVIDPAPPERRRRAAERIGQLRALSRDEAEGAARALLAMAPFRIDMDAFETARNLTPAAGEALWKRIAAVEVRTGKRRIAVARREWDALREAILSALARAAAGISAVDLRQQVRSALGDLHDAGIDDLLRDDRIVRTARGISLPGMAASAPGVDESTRRAIEHALAGEALRPHSVPELARATGIREDRLRSALRALVAQRVICQISPGHYLAREAVRTNAEKAARLAAAGSLTLAAFRDETGCPRRGAVAILEFFDRSGFTARDGDLRTVRQAVEKVFG